MEFQIGSVRRVLCDILGVHYGPEVALTDAPRRPLEKSVEVGRERTGEHMAREKVGESLVPVIGFTVEVGPWHECRNEEVLEASKAQEVSGDSGNVILDSFV